MKGACNCRGVAQKSSAEAGSRSTPKAQLQVRGHLLHPDGNASASFDGQREAQLTCWGPLPVAARKGSVQSLRCLTVKCSSPSPHPRPLGAILRGHVALSPLVCCPRHAHFLTKRCLTQAEVRSCLRQGQQLDLIRQRVSAQHWMSEIGPRNPQWGCA
ncbi:hypothetical protein DAEQUDRAFT_368955 [Daedalea quercina L-15889]|uniref:Uncharacterized protein n=1 Tax=Daedalea quercina L-15889 TaxID=1314783 RepID=A0A165PAL7_9APHY|nr:hypothetical protein DAEQUDRAFT_368955 [Daedalea quercina L-15889]